MLIISKNSIDKRLTSNYRKKNNLSFKEVERIFLNNEVDVCKFVKYDGNDYTDFSCPGQSCSNCSNALVEKHYEVFKYSFKPSNVDSLT